MIEPNKPAVWLLPREQLHMYWQRISAAYHEFKGVQEVFTLEELGVLLLHNPLYALWLAVADDEIDGLCVTAFVKYPNRTELQIQAIAGKPLKRYLDDGLTKIEQYAVMMGAKEVVFDGRPGWQRLMSKRGYGVELRMRKDVRIAWSN